MNNESNLNMQESKPKKKMSLLLIVLTVVIIALGGYIVYDRIISPSKEKESSNETTDNETNDIDKNDDKDEKEDKTVKLEKGTFKYDTESGTVQVEGYVTVEQLSACDDICDPATAEKYDYVFFNVTRTENTDFQKYLNDSSSNYFINENAIGIGCVTDNVLAYYNNSDANGMKEYKLLESDTNKLMQSTKEKPIVLELERLLFTGGSGAPKCYSHITKITIK